MRLTTQDTSFLYAETASGPMHGAGVMVLEGEAPFERIFQHVESRLHLVPRYRQRLVFVPFNLARAKWVDDPDFKLENHVVRHEVPAGSSVADGIAFAIELNEALMDRRRPLWSMQVIEGVPGHTLILHQNHHAMIDGVSGVDVSMVLLDLAPDAPPPPPPEHEWKPDPLPNPFDLMSEAVGDGLQSLHESLPSAGGNGGEERAEHVRRGTEVATRFLTSPVIQAPWNAGMVGPKRKLAWTRHPFAEFREIRRSFGGTINDVVLTVVTEAAARYLAAHDEPAENQRFRVMCPVSVRREDERGELGNRVSGIFPLLPAWPMDVVERLQAVREETERIKANQEAQALEMVMESMPEIPPVAMAQTLLIGTPFDPTAWTATAPPPVPPRFGPRLPFFGFSFTCTNVPGVQVPQFIAGYKVLYTVLALMLSGPLGYGVAVSSYNQDLFFHLMSEPRLLPDVERMREGVDEAFYELLQEARRADASADATPAALTQAGASQ